MLHATCDECGKPVQLDVNPTGAIEIILEDPQVVEDEDGMEVEVGGEAVEVAIVDPSTGEPLNKHLCRECLVYKIASVANPDEPTKGDPADGDDGGGGDDDNGGADDGDDNPADGDAEPVPSTGDSEEGTE